MHPHHIPGRPWPQPPGCPLVLHHHLSEGDLHTRLRSPTPVTCYTYISSHSLIFLPTLFTISLHRKSLVSILFSSPSSSIAFLSSPCSSSVTFSTFYTQSNRFLFFIFISVSSSLLILFLFLMWNFFFLTSSLILILDARDFTLLS